jgi:tetratricopeptide (TPR) repeat protein
MPDVFISHSKSDQRFIDNLLLPALHAHGISTWYSKKDIHTAEEWDRMIVHGLEESQWFLVVLTEHATKSEWLRAEVLWAMENRRGKIIPLLLRDCNVTAISLLLKKIQYVDFRSDKQAGLRTLLQIWNKTHAPAASKPTQTRKNKRITIATIALTLVCIIELVIYYSRKYPPENSYDKGLTAYKKADFKTATDYFTAALTSNPNDTNALIYRAAAWKQLNSFANAKTDLLKVIPLVRYRPTLYYQLGTVQYDLGAFPESVQAFTKAIDLGYPYHEIYVDRGDALRRAGHTPDACEDYKTAADLGESDGLANYNQYCRLK